MRFIFVEFMFIVAGFVAYAAAPSTSCPSGYVAVTRSDFILSDACSAGYVSTGTLTSCLTSATNGCWMYVPAGMSFTDEKGTYEYTASCPLT